MGFLTFFLALLLPVLGCSFDAAKRRVDPQTFRMALGAEPPLLDPQLSDTGVSVFIVKQVLSTLFQYDSQQRIRPYDAQSYEWQQQGRRLHVIVRADLHWSDGVPLDACHYRDGILRALEPKMPSTLADLFEDIRGAAEYKKGKLQGSQVGVLCDAKLQSLTFDVLRPYSSKLLHALAFVISAPIRKERVEKFGESWLLGNSQVKPLGTGAYVISEWSHDRRVRLKSRASLGEQHLAIDRVAKVANIDLPIVKELNTTFAMYESGELDVLDDLSPTLVPKLKGRSDFIVAQYPTTYFVGFSLKANPVLKDKKVRQALAFSAGQFEVPNLLKGGEREAKGWVYPDLLPDSAQPQQSLYDLPRAKKLLAEAGYGAGHPLPKLVLSYNSGERHQLLMERLVFRWKTDLGIEVDLNPMDWKLLVSQVKTKPSDLYRYAWNAVYPDALFFLELFQSQGLNNFGGWSNKEFDELLASLESTSMEHRDESYAKKLSRAQDILVHDDPALIPIYHYSKNCLLKPYVKNLRWNLMGMTPLREVEIQGVKN